MKLSKSLALVSVLALSTSLAFAQHGRSGGSAGGGMGSTMSGSHGNSGMAGDHSGAAGMHDSSTPSTHSQGKMSPDQVLSNNTKLSSNLDKLLPAGMTAQQACSGFKNLGQCVAAIHVSHNLNIPFADLKSKMTGGDKLGKAIKELKPDADSKAETKKANQQADADLNETNS